VPIISVFFGIVIRMFYKEHEPPHFHAEHQGQDAKFDFAGHLMVGEMRSSTARRMKLPSVVRAEHAGGFRVRLWFNDESEGTVDFEPWLEGPMFEPLKSPGYFQRFFLEGGTVAWPNGADVAPETLYDAVLGARSNHAAPPTAPTDTNRRG
jgi:hypothetical protein